MSALLPPGTVLGKYELIRHVAVGGMAEIHLARATGIEGFEKAVILKRILPHYVADPGFVRMFLDEARLAATLHHPNVVQVYDIGHDGGSYFFTMEYVHGADLMAVLQACARAGRGLALEHSLTIACGVAAGLHYAHEKRASDGAPLRIVHRDVSPSNVLVTYDGGVKLADFGIAKAAARPGVTRDGAIKGKAPYMSPEQVRGEELDRRSDVFSLGILLYELTTGRRLYRGESDYAIFDQIVNDAVPPPTQRRPGYHEALERIVLRALAKDPDARYASAEELQVDVEEFARQQQLSLSSVSLARFMRELFGADADAAAAERELGATPRRLDATPVPGHAVTPPPTGELTPARAPAPRSRAAMPAIVAAALATGALITWAATRPSPPAAVPAAAPVAAADAAPAAAAAADAAAVADAAPVAAAAADAAPAPPPRKPKPNPKPPKPRPLDPDAPWE